ncbi:hypothetical protein BDK92_7255 [Micromonospora pisi]|uniref:Uncharacterized protein n=1 Tax=Micromonospora pisi TaxID=589240 RepID=A0A495JW52_9ACTN|nr:hypothetical protein [Micromonospora pisi]RKR92775.1 hypothetical protein BDK92_7255 [Micromonospora pisi]
MATDVGVGDAETPRLTVTPFDGTTAATLVVTGPGGTTSTLVPYVEGTNAGVQTWITTPVTYTYPGRWVLTWTVTGTGAGVETQEVYVSASPVAGGPTWTPGRSRVANYVPTRTLVRSTATTTTKADIYPHTFDSTTRPAGVQVDRLIADGVAWVTTVAPTVTTALAETASVAAALYAAAAVERGWPDSDVSLNRATQLQQLAERTRADLVRALADETGTTPGQDHAVMPIYSFPRPVPWGDDYL